MAKVGDSDFDCNGNFYNIVRTTLGEYYFELLNAARFVYAIVGKCTGIFCCALVPVRAFLVQFVVVLVIEKFRHEEVAPFICGLRVFCFVW
jgi:hypothetical protein